MFEINIFNVFYIIEMGVMGIIVEIIMFIFGGICS